MENEARDNENLEILCCKLPRKREWIWLYTTVHGTISFALHLTSVLVDSIVAYRLIWTHNLLITGLTTSILIYLPVVFTLYLSPPKPQPSFECLAVAAWILKTLFQAAILPVTISVRLLKRVIWTVNVIHVKKPYEEIFHEYELLLPKEVHSYLFLQAFLHCFPQAVIQTYLILLQVPLDKYTEFFQVTSLLSSVITVAMCTMMFHRYEAQVVGGRSPVLLLHPPEVSEVGIATTLLPRRSCIRSEIISVEKDCFLGKVVSFFSWFFLIHSRILCLVIAHETHPLTTGITTISHFAVMLLYLLLSQHTTFGEIPSRVLNAVISIVALVEVSLRFHKITLLYVLFFVSIVVEDTMLTVLFFIYSSDLCSNNTIVSCDHFGMYTYIIINSHVVGVMLFAIYLSSYQPGSQVLPLQG